MRKFTFPAALALILVFSMFAPNQEAKAQNISPLYITNTGWLPDYIQAKNFEVVTILQTNASDTVNNIETVFSEIDLYGRSSMYADISFANLLDSVKFQQKAWTTGGGVYWVDLYPSYKAAAYGDLSSLSYRQDTSSAYISPVIAKTAVNWRTTYRLKFDLEGRGDIRVIRGKHDSGTVYGRWLLPSTY